MARGFTVRTESLKTRLRVLPLSGMNVQAHLSVTQKRLLDWREIAVIAWSVFLSATLFGLFRQRGFDDPFITYRYAEHVAQGTGFVYNPGERVLSTTTPLYTLLLALLRVAGLDLPVVSNAIGCVSLVASGWAVYRLALLWRSMGVGLAGLLLLPTFPHLLLTLGAEACFFLACVLFAFLFYEERRYSATALLLALATLTRADGVLAGIVMGIDFLVVRRGRIPWRALLLYVGLLAPWFVFAWIYFGAPLPVTLFAKQQQGRMPQSQSFFDGLFYYGRGYWNQPRYWAHFGFAALGFVNALVRRPRWLLIPVWSLLYFAAYSALGVTRYFWYYAPLIPGFIVLIGIGLDTLGRLVERAGRQRLGQGLALVLAVLMLLVQSGSLNRLRHMNDHRLFIYQTLGEWLATNTPPEATVGTLEVGIIGYYSQRQMIDFGGLIQPEVALRFGPASGYDDAALWAVERFKPQYLVLPSGALPGLEQRASLRDQCNRLKSFTDQGYNGQLDVYRCAW
jgi:hypothetical protein